MTFMLGSQPDGMKIDANIYFTSFVLAVMGVSMYAALIAFVVLLLMQRTSSYQEFRGKVDRVTKEMEHYGLPSELQVTKCTAWALPRTQFKLMHLV